VLDDVDSEVQADAPDAQDGQVREAKDNGLEHHGEPEPSLGRGDLPYCKLSNMPPPAPPQYSDSGLKTFWMLQV
jgi:hypothetical protein